MVSWLTKSGKSAVTIDTSRFSKSSLPETIAVNFPINLSMDALLLLGDSLIDFSSILFVRWES